jgi:hypothetical protein
MEELEQNGFQEVVIMLEAEAVLLTADQEVLAELVEEVQEVMDPVVLELLEQVVLVEEVVVVEVLVALELLVVQV